MKEKVTKWMQKRHKHIFPQWYVVPYIVYYKWCKKHIRTWSKEEFLNCDNIEVVIGDCFDDGSKENFRPSSRLEIDAANSCWIDPKNKIIASKKEIWLSDVSYYPKAKLFAFEAPYRWISEDYFTLSIHLEPKKYMTRLAQKQIAVFQHKLPQVLLNYLILFAIDVLEEDVKIQIE
jgi:hypothetical protein